MTKILTAILTVRLCQDQNISVDADVTTAFGAVSKTDVSTLSGISIRQLLNQSHGLDDRSLAPFPRRADGRIDLTRTCDRLTEGRRLFEPGALFSYSDSGALLAGALLEEFSGETYGAYLASALLDDLGVLVPSTEPSQLAHISPTTGGALEVRSVDLLAIAKYLCGSSNFATATQSELKLMCSNPIDFPGWTPMGRSSCIGLNRFGGDWYGYSAARENAGSLLLRFHPESSAAIAITSKGPDGYRFMQAMFADNLPECLSGTPPRPLSESALAQVDIESIAGTYQTAMLSAEIQLTPARQLLITISNRSADEKLLSAPIQRKLRLAEENSFYSIPVDMHHFAFGQYRHGTDSGGQYEYLWNSRRLWRRVQSA